MTNKSNTEALVKDQWGTDPAVVRWLERMLGIAFDVDVCGTPENTKAPVVITRDPRWFHDCQGGKQRRFYWDAMHTDWARLGRYGFMNPPFSLKHQFVPRAELMARRGMTVVGILPVALTAGWFRDMEQGVSRLLIPDKRIQYVHPTTGQLMRGVNFESLVAVWEPRRRVELERVRVFE